MLSVSLFLLLPLVAMGVQVSGKNKAEAKGIVLLDAMTYPVVIDQLVPEARVIIGIFDKKHTIDEEVPTLEYTARSNYLNFAVAYPRDDEIDLSTLIFAQIIVNGGENKFLKNRLVGERQLPIFVVLGENRSSPYVIDVDVRDYRYCNFISMLNSYAGFKLKLPGILEAFDALVPPFVNGDREDRMAVIKQGKEQYESLDNKKDMADADFYLTTMQKIMEEGMTYVKEEGGRIIGRARLPMVNEERRYALDKRLNILESFLRQKSDERIYEAAAPYAVEDAEAAEL